MRAVLLAGALPIALAGAATAQEATFALRHMTPETAITLAQAALVACRNQGFQVAVAVVDRSGVTQAFMRDRLAGPHTVDIAVNKAWTAVSFRQDTLSFTEATMAPAASALRAMPRIVAIGGGVPVQAAGAIVGAVGVSGAPGGQADDACARAGIAAVQGDLDF